MRRCWCCFHKRIPVLFGVLVVSSAGSAFTATAAGDTPARNADRVPTGLSASDWSAIRAAHEANRHNGDFGDGGARYVLGADPLAQQAYLKASNTDPLDLFGYSVAVSGDTVVIGAYSEDSNATGVNGNHGDNSANAAGAAYVFVRDEGGNWNQQAYLKASNTDVTDLFGYSVAVSGDTVVVGAYSEDSSATGVNGDQGDNSAAGSGAAYVFVRNGTTWSQQAYLKSSNSTSSGAGDNFGVRVAVSGDTIVVGAHLEDSNATGVNGNDANNSALDSGAAYVFVRNGSSWSQQAYLKASNTGTLDWFGLLLAVSGDTIVVAAYREDSNATGINGNQGNGGSATLS